VPSQSTELLQVLLFQRTSKTDVLPRELRFGFTLHQCFNTEGFGTEEEQNVCVGHG